MSMASVSKMMLAQAKVLRSVPKKGDGQIQFYLLQDVISSCSFSSTDLALWIWVFGVLKGVGVVFPLSALFFS